MERNIGQNVPEGLSPDELVCSPVFWEIVAEQRAKGLLRNRGIGFLWRFPGATFEENAARAVANVQLVFLKEFPESKGFFDEQCLLRSGVDHEAAKRFVLDKVGTGEKFQEILPSSALQKATVPFFEGTFSTVLIRSFRPSGINIGPADFSPRPQGYWNQATIQAEALGFFTSKGEINRRLLLGADRYDLVSAIDRKYPDAWRGLRKDLNLEQERKSDGYWLDPANVEAEARNVLQAGASLSHSSVLDIGRSSLSNAITHFYPGGRDALYEKLGVVDLRKPQGYWDVPENFEVEARRAFAAGVKLYESDLEKAGFGGLVGSLHKYPGRMVALRGKVMEEKGNTVSADEIFGEFFEEDQK